VAIYIVKVVTNAMFQEVGWSYCKSGHITKVSTPEDGHIIIIDLNAMIDCIKLNLLPKMIFN